MQGFWRLAEALPVDDPNEVERYNHQLAIDLEGDIPTKNIDRILRIPGTINWPDKRKRKKGREPALADLIECHPERTYDIGQFEKATVKSKPKS